MEEILIQINNTEGIDAGDTLAFQGREYQVVRVVDGNTLLVVLRA